MSKALPAFLIGALLLLGLGGLALFGSNSAENLDRSVIGTEALSTVLQGAGIGVERSNPHLSSALQDLSLRVLPLYDMDLSSTEVSDTSPRNLGLDIYWRKVSDLPSIVILPKWRGVAASEQLAAPETMIPLRDFATLLWQVGLGRSHLVRLPAAIQQRDAKVGTTLALFSAQVFLADSLPQTCKPALWFGQMVLAVECRASANAQAVWFVSDPDLMSNHGLTLGENAAGTQAFFKRLLKDAKAPVYLDTSTEILTFDRRVSAEMRDYSRTSGDLARFFAPPFASLWAMLLILLALLLWRGAVRFGPLRVDTETARSKLSVIETRARLLRLNGHDARMVADFVHADLARTAEETFGRGRADTTRLFALLSGRNASQAETLRHLAETLTRGEARSPAELTRNLATYRSLMENLTDGPDLVRLSNPR